MIYRAALFSQSLFRRVIIRRTPNKDNNFYQNFIARQKSTAVRNMELLPSNSCEPVIDADIPLTRREEQLRDLLLDIARYIDESNEIKERLELRFAGGWVRDKLLGIESNDIDTVINSMTGYSFSLKMKKFLEDPVNLKKHGLVVEDVGDLHVIAANPEMSKNLETATVKMLGFDVDFVNLRKETYSVDSRTPVMEFGTAEEDALRRDATVNALFYNLNTGEVEDFIGGIRDMQNKLLRTPLEPFRTFMDDPLRVLRLIRFSSRLDFEIHADTEACMAHPAVRGALKLKISRERVGTEVEKMLKGNQTVIICLDVLAKPIVAQHPRHALQLFDSLGLYSTIFTDPTVNNAPEPSISRWKYAYDCLDILSSNESPGSIYKLLIRSKDAAKVAWILAALTPWAEVAQPSRCKHAGKVPLPFATSVAREGIKLNNKICDIVTGAFRNFEEISSFKSAVVNNEPWTKERDKLGMAIRRWDSSGGHWELQAMLAILVEAMRSQTSGGEILQLYHKPILLTPANRL